MRECEGCGAPVAGDRPICPDCGTPCTALTVGAAQPYAAPPVAPPVAPGPPPGGAPWERFAPPVASAGPAPDAGRGAPHPQDPGPAAAAPPAAGLTAPTPFTHHQAPSTRVVVRSSAIASGSSFADRGAGTILAAIASAAIVVSALLDWTILATAFDVPLLALFTSHVTHREPRLGYLVMACGVAALVVTFASRRARWRVLLGGVAVAVPILFALRVQSALSGKTVELNHVSLTNLLGVGPWVCGLAGLALIGSSFFER